MTIAITDVVLRDAHQSLGRGAFCKPAKVACEGCWRYQKCEC